MSRLTRLGIKYATVVFLVVLLLFGAGVWAASQIRQDLLPDISLPFYAVITPDRGASPSTIDREITLPVSDAMQGLAGVNTVQSSSTSGVSIVAVEFNDGTDPNVAQQEMSAQLNSVRATLPQQAQASTIQAFSTSQLPILEYAISGQESLGALSTRVQAVALPKLKGVSGVSNVELTGAPTQQVEVTLNPRKLALHHISASAVSAALQQASMVQSAGTLEQDGHTVPVEISGGITSVEQIANTMVGTGAEAPATGTGGLAFPAPAAAAVPIRDLATVALVAAPADTITRTNGRPSIGLQVIKSPDANTVAVANAVKAALPGIERQIGHGVSFQDVSDEATPITAAISGILREGLLGALFAVVVIFAFLRNLRATLVAAISIPLSLLVALIILWWQGITLNILTLGAMMVAVGRVVDDAIVVLENITRHVSEGEAPLAAAYTGGREIITAVTASTLTTVAVFLPIAFLTGIAGDFFRPFALTVVTALLASLVVAVTVVPMLASRFLPTPRKTVPDSARTLLQRGYIPVIRWATGHRGPVIGAAALFFVASMALVPHLRVNLLDQSSSPSFPVSITMPANSTLAQTDAQTQMIESLVRSQAGVNGYQATVGGSVDPFAPPGTVPADPTRAQVLVLVKQNSYDSALAAVTSALAAYSGPAKVSVGSGQGGETASASQMQLTVTAPGSGALDQATRQVEQALYGVPGLSQITSNLVASKPEYRLVPGPGLARSGLGPQQLAAIVAQAADGQVAAQAALPSGTVSVLVALPPGTADTPGALSSLPIPTPAGVVPLSSLATLREAPGPQGITRTNGQQTATITGDITSNNTRQVQAKVASAIAGLHLPPGASTSTGGAFQQLSTVLQQFALAILAAIGLVYLIMVATFRSLLKPLILLVSIPFAATGAIIALAVTGTSLSLPGLIGILMLTGIVVTNAIVLLDLVEQYRDRGLPLEEALVEGGRHRLRPILMTASATVLALVPLALSGSGGGAFISAPLAIVVIGGLFTSTVLTLVLVPVLYSLSGRFAGARGQRSVDRLLDSALARRQEAMVRAAER